MKWVDIQKKIRKMWTINPKSRVKESKKKYNRNRHKKETRKEIDNA